MDSMMGLLAREEIRALVNQYCHDVWESDIDGYMSLFVEGAVIHQQGMGITGTVTGLREIRALIDDASKTRKPRPLLHNHVVTLIDATHATGAAHVEVIDGTSPGLERSSIARYRDEYVKVDGRWLFQLRELTFLSVSPTMGTALTERALPDRH